jgi:hypothetical protein
MDYRTYEPGTIVEGKKVEKCPYCQLPSVKLVGRESTKYHHVSGRTAVDGVTIMLYDPCPKAGPVEGKPPIEVED